MRYVISYDLQTPEQHDDRLYEALLGLGAQRLLQSQWIVRRIKTTAAGLRDSVGQHIDANDRLLVTCLDSKEWAGRNVMVDPNTV